MLPPATKLGQGNIFRSVCQEFCSRGGVSRPTPRGRLRGLAGGRGVLRPTPREEVEGCGRGVLQAHTWGGVSRPTPGGKVEGSGQEGGSSGPHLGGLQAHTWGGRLRGLARRGFFRPTPGGSPGPHPGGRLRGLARRGSSGPHPGGRLGVWLGGSMPTPEGVSRPIPRGGGSPGPHPGGGCIPACTEADTPRPQQTATAAGGTHPTGMHSCFDDKIVVLWALPLCNLIEISLSYRVSFNIIARSD